MTIWKAATLDDAVAAAEADAADYVRALGNVEFVGLAQAYHMPEPPDNGAEVFSLMRDSELDPPEYLNRFFDTGKERQRHGPLGQV